MGSDSSNVDLDSLNGIKHQLAQFFIEQIKAKRVVESGIWKEGVLSKGLLGYITKHDILQVVSYKITSREPVTAETVVAYLSEFTFRTGWVGNAHTAFNQ